MEEAKEPEELEEAKKDKEELEEGKMHHPAQQKAPKKDPAGKQSQHVNNSLLFLQGSYNYLKRSTIQPAHEPPSLAPLPWHRSFPVFNGACCSFKLIVSISVVLQNVVV